MIHAPHKQTCYETPLSMHKNVSGSISSDSITFDAREAAKRGVPETTDLYERPLLAENVDTIVHPFNHIVN
jgi:hypothetical protein